MSLSLVADVVGVCGVSLVVLAYMLLVKEKVSIKRYTYHAMNLCGAILILLSLLVHWNTASVLIELVWITISLYGLWSVRTFTRADRDNV